MIVFLMSFFRSAFPGSLWVALVMLALPFASGTAQEMSTRVRVSIPPSGRGYALIEIVGTRGDTLDFGTGAPGVYRRTLTVLNPGSDTLLFQGDPDSDCGCISGQLDKLIIPPGDSAKLRVEFLVSSIPRRLSHDIILWSNARGRSPVTLVVTVNVVPEIGVVPPTFLLKNLKAGKETQATVIIKNRSEAPISFSTPTLVDTAGMRVRIKIPERFTLRPSEELKVGAAVIVPRDPNPTAYLRLATSCASQPEVRVYLVWDD
ncbi:MAG: hypothetical protein JWQ98_1086 [Chlorobi bacterium]|nr:hypothetical protein [Chlorobiota bacterium]